MFQRPEIEDFLVKHFDREVLQLFRGLVPYAYQSDLARYCLLYVYGGWYVDLTLKMLTSLRVADHIDMIVFADRGCASMCQPWAIQNGLIYSRPKNPIFLRLIEEFLLIVPGSIMVRHRCVQLGQIVLALRLLKIPV